MFCHVDKTYMKGNRKNQGCFIKTTISLSSHNLWPQLDGTQRQTTETEINFVPKLLQSLWGGGGIGPLVSPTIYQLELIL